MFKIMFNGTGLVCTRGHSTLSSDIAHQFYGYFLHTRRYKHRTHVHVSEIKTLRRFEAAFLRRRILKRYPCNTKAAPRKRGRRAPRQALHHRDPISSTRIKANIIHALPSFIRTTASSRDMATQVGSLQLASSRALSYAVTSPSSDGQHPFVLLASPLCTTLAVWDPVVPHLTALGFRVLRYDPPGHGSSGVPSDLSSTTFDSIAQDVRDLLTHLDVQKVHTWIGDSLGAATAITFAAKYPGLVERLVPCCTISSSPINTGAADTFGPRVAAAREAGNMDATIEETLGRWFGRDWLDSHPEEAERMRKLMHDTSIDGFETCCAALQSRTFDIRPLAADAGRHIEAALLLVGEKDAGLGPVMEELRQGIETGLRSKKGETVSVDLKTVRNGGHVPFIDGSESFWEHITPFLK